MNTSVRATNAPYLPWGWAESPTSAPTTPMTVVSPATAGMLHKQDEFVLSCPLPEGPCFDSWHVSLHIHLDASLTTFFWAFVTSHIPPFTPLPFLFNARVAFPTWLVRFLFLPLGLMAWFRPLIIQRRNVPAGSVYTNLNIYMRAWWRLVLQHVHSVPHWLGVKSKLISSVCTGSYIRIILCI